MTDWLATILIFLPLAGAILVWLIPFGRAAGSVALLFALAEVGFWINALTKMDFDSPSVTPNFDQQVTWFSDLDVSYHVGFYAFSFWRSSSWRLRSRTASGSGATGRGPTSG
jgi:NADH:ubiquinone oxidoreductase subunit 4 (subunit M)